METVETKTFKASSPSELLVQLSVWIQEKARKVTEVISIQDDPCQMVVVYSDQQNR